MDAYRHSKGQDDYEHPQELSRQGLSRIHQRVGEEILVRGGMKMTIIICGWLSRPIGRAIEKCLAPNKRRLDPEPSLSQDV